MKRSTALASVRRAISEDDIIGASPGDTAERIVAALEGNRPWDWDPEEPELPKFLRVSVDGANNARLWPGDSTWNDDAHELAGYRAAADAYNRLQAGEAGELMSHDDFMPAVAGEMSTALSRLAREAGVPDDGPDEIVEAVLAKLSKQPDIRRPDVISKYRGGRSIHYAVGPARDSRDEAWRDLRVWFDKEDA